MKTTIDAPAEESSAEESYLVLRRDVANRLRHSCADWAPNDFDEIVEKVTRTAMKYPPSRFDRSLSRST